MAEVLITLSILGVVAYDSANSPKYGVAMRADEGAANKSDTKSEEISNVTLDDTDGVKVFTVKLYWVCLNLQMQQILLPI